MIANLGKALTILNKASIAESAMHADVDAFHAPSECHTLVARGEARRLRRARKHAEAVARAPVRVILRQAQRRSTERGLRVAFDRCENAYWGNNPYHP
jgi:hypothetical protein